MQKTQSRIPPKGPSPEPALKIGRQLIKVLLISGDPKITYLVRRAMAEAGAGAFALECADALATGLEGLAGGDVDVLLLCPGVPDSHDLSDSAWGRARAMGVPIILLSPADDEAGEVRALEKGAQEFLPKKAMLGASLVRAIYRAIARQRLFSESEQKARKSEASEANLQAIVKSNPDGIIIVDEKGVVRFVNPAVESLFGCKAEQLLGESLDFLPAVENGQTELSITRGDGKQGIVEIRLVKTKYQGQAAYLACLHDITERKKPDEVSERVRAASEKAVAKAKEEARLAKESAEKVRAASGQAVARAREEARLVKEAAEKVKAALERAITQAKEEARLARASRKASEEAIARAEEEMRHLDPMQSEFMSNIVHELRTPLHSILAFTKLIIEGRVADRETQREFLAIIEGQGEHLRRLVDELLDIMPVKSGPFELRKEKLAIKELLQGSVREFSGVAGQRHITLKEEMPAVLPTLEVDSQRLRQVMFNLLGNAIKFSSDGGSVSVRAEVRDGSLLVQVADQGVGIAEEAMPFLFQKFYQAKNTASVGGLGLGLYISKRIIEAHGGQIWAESREGAGSTFSFTLPLE
jgi:signal transduction histidine kinase/DNA-binding NarL/FixJ family response regulator